MEELPTVRSWSPNPRVTPIVAKRRACRGHELNKRSRQAHASRQGKAHLFALSGNQRVSDVLGRDCLQRPEERKAQGGEGVQVSVTRGQHSPAFHASVATQHLLANVVAKNATGKFQMSEFILEQIWTQKSLKAANPEGEEQLC